MDGDPSHLSHHLCDIPLICKIAASLTPHAATAAGPMCVPGFLCDIARRFPASSTFLVLPVPRPVPEWPVHGLEHLGATSYEGGLPQEALSPTILRMNRLSSSLPPPGDKPRPSCGAGKLCRKVLPVLGQLGREGRVEGLGAYPSFVYLRLKLKKPDPIFGSLSLRFPFY